jgi:hypothetical protein
MTGDQIQQESPLVTIATEPQKKLSAVDRAIARFSGNIGVETSKVIQRDAEWARMLKIGALVHLHIRRWRALDTVTHKDMGVVPANEAERKAWASVFKDLGQKRLLPEEQMTRDDRLEGTARALHVANTQPTYMGRYMLEGPASCGLCGAKELPETRFEHLTEMHVDWIEANFPEVNWRALLDNLRSDEPEAIIWARKKIEPIADKSGGVECGWKFREWELQTLLLQRAYYKSRDELCQPETWAMYQQKLGLEYAIIGYENYSRLLAAGAKDLPDDRDEFVRDFVRKALSKVPTREQVYDSYFFEWEIEFVPLAAEMAGDQAEAAIAYAEKKAALELARARNELEVEAIRKRQKDLNEAWDRVIGDMQEDVRSAVYDQCLNALRALGKPENKGSMPSQTIVMLRNLYDRIGAVNFWDDAELKGQIAAVKQMIELPKNVRDEMPLKTLLEDMAAESALVLWSIDRGPARSGIEWGIPETPEGLVAFTRGRRGEIGFDDTTEIETLDMELGAKRQRQSATFMAGVA